MTSQELRQKYKWTKPIRLNTKRGERILQKTPFNEELAQWIAINPRLAWNLGISVSNEYNDSTKKVICWWQQIDAQLEAQTEEMSKAADIDWEPPQPKDLKFKGYQKAGIKFALDAYRNGFPGTLI